MRRLRTHLGMLSLIALMAAVASFLVAAAPRTLQRIENDALRHAIAESPASVRDLMLTVELPNQAADDLAQARDRIEGRFAEVLRSSVADRWYAVQSPASAGISDAFPEFEGKPPLIDFRIQDRITDAIRMVDGEFPGTPESPLGRESWSISVAVSEETAEALRLTVGSQFRIAGGGGVPETVVTVAGIFEPLDPHAPIWQDHPQTIHPAIPRPLQQDPPTYLATMVVHPDAVDSLAFALPESEALFRYRLDEQRLDARQTEAIATALNRLASGSHGVSGAYLSTGLDHLVERFQNERAATLAVVAVVLAGLLATMLGTLVLAARMSVERRTGELALWRARGASLTTIGARLVADAALLVVPAVLVGTVGALLLPLPDTGFPWLTIGILVVALTATPALALPRLRRTGVVAARSEIALLRPSLRRLTVEATLLVLAVVGVILMHRRGLQTSGGIDPYLSTVPVLVGLGVAVLMLRLYPWPLRLAGRIMARRRGAVGFLGAARAGRTTPAATLPLVVLVMAVAVGVFSGVVRASIDESRDRTAWQEVGADLRVSGVAFGPTVTAELADVPGVRAVAAMVYSPSTKLYHVDHASRDLGSAVVIAVDAPAYQRVLDAAGIDYRLPRSLTEATSDADLPAVASPRVAELAEAGQVPLGSQLRRYRVAEVVETFPGMVSGTTGFLILPLQVLPESGPGQVFATDLLVAGPGADTDRLVTVAAENQRDTVAQMAEAAAGRLANPTVLTRAERREQAERSGLNAELTVAFTAGIAGAASFVVLAAGFTIVVSARSRSRLLARLRTLGLSRAGARGLLVWELAPLMLVSVVAGTAVGAGLPWLLGPALGLEQFSGGAEPRIVMDPVSVSLTLALVAVMVAGAIAVEAVRVRRPRGDGAEERGGLE